MLLYRLQNKQTKKFVAGIRWYDGRISWTTTGAFFRTADSIHKYLDYLIGEYVQREKDRFPRHTPYRHKNAEKPNRREGRNKNSYAVPGDPDKADWHVWSRRHRSRLKLYRVVINDVLVKGERFITASKFMGKDKK